MPILVQGYTSARLSLFHYLLTKQPNSIRTCSDQMEKRSSMEMVDRISGLPDSILHHIMSLLSFKQAVGTSTLSKTWKQAWFTFPIIEFHDHTTNNEKLRLLQRWRKRENFEDMIRNRKQAMISSTKFTLDIQEYHNDSKLESFINGCLCYAIESNLKELKLELHYFWNRSNQYKLPETILCSESIDVLVLTGCDLALQRNYLKLSSLRKLSLTKVKFGNDPHEFIESLVVGCPSIDYLSINRCYLFQATIMLSGLHKLKEIIMKDDWLDWVEMKELLNVESVSILGNEEHYTVSKINVASCTNIKCLTLFRCSITDECLFHHVRNLPLLEYLNIEYLVSLKRIDISSSSLKTLIIGVTPNWVEAKIDTPSLCKFKYTGYVRPFSLNALALSEVDLCPRFIYSSQNKLHSKYVELLGKFNRVSKVVNLGILYNVEAVMVPESVRKVVPSPLSSLKHLNFTLLEFVNNGKGYSLFSIMDCLFWVAPHVETTVIKVEKRSIKYCFQISYYQEEIASCCKSLPVSCWYHCIKEVKIRIHNELEGDNVEGYSLEGEEIMKKLDSITI